MGYKQGVQKRLLEISNKSLCVLCSSHSLNLVVADAAKSPVLSVTFFGISTILINPAKPCEAHCQKFSTTRCECCIDSIKALCHQLSEMVEASTVLCEHASEKKDGETLCLAQNLYKDLTSWQFVLCVVFSVWISVYG